MAAEYGLESASAAVFGGPLVGLLAEFAFGYVASDLDIAATPERLRERNASALRQALLWLTLVPWALCLACFLLVERYYPRDRDRIRYGNPPAGGAKK